MSNDKKWRLIKETLKEGLSPHQANVMDVVLENTANEFARRQHMNQAGAMFLTENASAQATSTGNIAALNQVVLPILRRVLPGTIANEIIGVQPMKAPYGQIVSFRLNYGKTAAGATQGQEMFAPLHVSDIARAYSGNENNSAPGAGDTIAMEGVPGNPVTLELVKLDARVKTRRMSAKWTIESAQDANALYGIDIEAEAMAGIAQHITLEIDQEILTTLRAMPPTPTADNTFDQSAISGTHTFVGDQFAALAILIGKEANDIAHRTRMGVGNFAVVSPQALTVLQSAKASAFARTTEGEFEGPVNIQKVGKLNGYMDIYCDVYANVSSPVLVGYKGNEVKSGLYYCPYVPLMSVPVMYDPQTIEPQLAFMSRYAIVKMDNRGTSLGNSADFYGLVGIDSSNLTFF